MTRNLTRNLNVKGPGPEIVLTSSWTPSLPVTRTQAVQLQVQVDSEDQVARDGPVRVTVTTRGARGARNLKFKLNLKHWHSGCHCQWQPVVTASGTRSSLNWTRTRLRGKPELELLDFQTVPLAVTPPNFKLNFKLKHASLRLSATQAGSEWHPGPARDATGTGSGDSESRAVSDSESTESVERSSCGQCCVAS